MLVCMKCRSMSASSLSQRSWMWTRELGTTATLTQASSLAQRLVSVTVRQTR